MPWGMSSGASSPRSCWCRRAPDDEPSWPGPWPLSRSPPPGGSCRPIAFDPEPRPGGKLGRVLGTLFLDGFGLEDLPPGGGRGGGHPPVTCRIPTPRISPTWTASCLTRRDDLPGAGRSHPAAPGDLRNLAQPVTARGPCWRSWTHTVTPMGARRLGRWLRYPLQGPGRHRGPPGRGGIFQGQRPAAASAGVRP